MFARFAEAFHFQCHDESCWGRKASLSDLTSFLKPTLEGASVLIKHDFFCGCSNEDNPLPHKQYNNAHLQTSVCVCVCVRVCVRACVCVCVCVRHDMAHKCVLMISATEFPKCGDLCSKQTSLLVNLLHSQMFVFFHFCASCMIETYSTRLPVHCQFFRHKQHTCNLTLVPQLHKKATCNS